MSTTLLISRAPSPGWSGFFTFTFTSPIREKPVILSQGSSGPGRAATSTSPNSPRMPVPLTCT